MQQDRKGIYCHPLARGFMPWSIQLPGHTPHPVRTSIFWSSGHVFVTVYVTRRLPNTMDVSLKAEHGNTRSVAVSSLS